jgi:pimeloyl-ACP methyl ester carboxylesterase
MKRIYCISGLGADQRIFRKLQIPGAELVPVPWPAFDKHDDMPCYAQKIMAQIPDERPTIIGVSFGGMLSVEIARQISINKAFIVSSAKTIAELPPVSGFLQFLLRNDLMPVGLFKNFHKQMYERFGVHTDEEKKLLVSILDDTDPAFVKWAFKTLLHWQNTEVPANIVHIHGTADRLIPPDHIRPNYWIDGGTHFMVYNRAGEISRIIAAELAE